MDPSAPVTASLRAKLSQPARSETKGRPSAPLDPNRATEERPTGGALFISSYSPVAYIHSSLQVSDKADGGGQKACAMRHWAKAAASLRLGFAMPFC
ncbi:hypothetical protein GOBAR_DD27395 [Gossypium barbadense]|nr:hypothetical protein GOBAR_DD27395 [Gossypium barbadense]